MSSLSRVRFGWFLLLVLSFAVRTQAQRNAPRQSEMAGALTTINCAGSTWRIGKPQNGRPAACSHAQGVAR